MTIKGYEDLEVYRAGYGLAMRIHKVSQGLPGSERYELGQQIRKAAISVPANIAEGYGRKDSEKEFKHFLRNAMGSANEVMVYIDMMRDLDYVEEEVHATLKKEYEVLARKLYQLIKRWENFRERSGV